MGGRRRSAGGRGIGGRSRGWRGVVIVCDGWVETCLGDVELGICWTEERMTYGGCVMNNENVKNLSLALSVRLEGISVKISRYRKDFFFIINV